MIAYQTKATITRLPTSSVLLIVGECDFNATNEILRIHVMLLIE